MAAHDSSPSTQSPGATDAAVTVPEHAEHNPKADSLEPIPTASPSQEAPEDDLPDSAAIKKDADPGDDEHATKLNPSEDPSSTGPSPPQSGEDQNANTADGNAASENQETAESAPPLPDEPVPGTEDDGWDYRWDYAAERFLFFNRFTKQEQFHNPRVAENTTEPTDDPNPAPPLPPNDIPDFSVAGGYNPAIHGNYDPNAWYAKLADPQHELLDAPPPDLDAIYAATPAFNRFTGQFQGADQGPGRHSDEAKSRRQMNSYFDVDAAANAHDGRSLRAERSGKKPSKSELKHFKERRKARKEEKRRAWLRD